MSALVQARNLTFRVGRRPLIAEATLELFTGTVTIIVGPNGAGKSTLVRLLSGELKPSAGIVLFEGEPIRQLSSAALARRRAVMTQANRLVFPFTVQELVRLGLNEVGRGMAVGDRQRVVARCMEVAAVSGLAHRLFSTLSGGEQRRVQFARALAQLEVDRTVPRRQVLLLDEPVANLDLRHQLALMDAVAATAAQGIAVLAVVHDLNLAASYADKVVAMKDGMIVASGSPSAVLRDDLISQVFGVSLIADRRIMGRRPLVMPRRWLAPPAP